jgi:DedD protein
MNECSSKLDESSRNRLIGALVWLGLLIIIVPSWYAHPVNFKPPSSNEKSLTSPHEAVASHPFYLSQDTTSSTPSSLDKKLPTIISKKTAVRVKSTPKYIPHVKQNIPSNKAHAQKNIVPSWILRVVSYRKKETAETLKDRLKYDYPAFVKYFPKSKYYSVRIGPYKSKSELLKDQAKIDRLLHVKSEFIEFKK